MVALCTVSKYVTTNRYVTKVQMQTEDGGGGAEENVLFRTSIHGWAGVIRTSVSQ